MWAWYHCPGGPEVLWPNLSLLLSQTCLLLPWFCGSWLLWITDTGLGEVAANPLPYQAPPMCQVCSQLVCEQRKWEPACPLLRSD